VRSGMLFSAVSALCQRGNLLAVNAKKTRTCGASGLPGTWLAISHAERLESGSAGHVLVGL